VTTSTETQTPRTVVLTDVAATKVKILLEQEGRDDLRLRIAVAAPACGISCFSTSGRWTGTWSRTTAASRWWSTG